ncbi:hypothetical protein LDENG_00215500 [Lucifuga dentata]|nr:hypothetical protein LDENG_00215500 [Lucifuga dentata]
MEAMLKNLASTAELLAVCQSEAVAQWDEQTVSRAFDWALYCEHLFSRFHGNLTVRKVMEKQLEITNQSLRAVFPGYTEVSFPDFSRCQYMLLSRLLNNPALPFSIIQTLFDTSSSLSTKNAQHQGAAGLCTQLIQCKSACKVLRPVTDFALRSSATGADAEVQGVMLWERLDALLSTGSESSRAEHFLDSVLQGCPQAVEHFCLVIAAALLTRTNSQTASEDFLLVWLQKKHSLLQHLCSTQPTALLTDLAKKNLKFSVAYCDTLKKWASDMEYNVSEGEWVQTSTNPSVSFQKLIAHFVALFEACPSLREDVEKDLKALKINDGDFNVRGLSIWGDLLLEIHK